MRNQLKFEFDQTWEPIDFAIDSKKGQKREEKEKIEWERGKEKIKLSIQNDIFSITCNNFH